MSGIFFVINIVKLFANDSLINKKHCHLFPHPHFKKSGNALAQVGTS